MNEHVWCHKHLTNCGGAWRHVGGGFEDACTDCNCPVRDHGERKRPVASQSPQEIIESVDQTPRITLDEFKLQLRAARLHRICDFAAIMLATELEALQGTTRKANAFTIDQIIADRITEVRKELE